MLIRWIYTRRWGVDVFGGAALRGGALLTEPMRQAAVILTVGIWTCLALMYLLVCWEGAASSGRDIFVLLSGLGVDALRALMGYFVHPNRIVRYRRPESATIRGIIETYPQEVPKPGSDHPVAASWRTRFINFTRDMCTRFGYERYEVGHSKASYSRPGELAYHWPRDVEAGAPIRTPFEQGIDHQAVTWCLVSTDTVEYHDHLSDIVDEALMATGQPPAVAVYAWALTAVAGRSGEGSFRFIGDHFNYRLGPTASYTHLLWDSVTLPDRVVWRGPHRAIIYEPFHMPIGENRVALWLQPRALLSGLYSVLYDPTVWRRIRPEVIDGGPAGVASANVLRLLSAEHGSIVSVAYEGATHSLDLSFEAYATLGLIKTAKRSGAQVALSREVVIRETKAEPALAGILASMAMAPEWRIPQQEYATLAVRSAPLEAEGNSDGDLGVRVVAYGDDGRDEGSKLRIMGTPTGVITGIPIAAAVAGRDADAVAFAERVVGPALEAQSKVEHRSITHLRKMGLYLASRVGMNSLVPLDLDEVERERLKRPSQRRLIDEEAYAVQSDKTNAFLKTEPIGVEYTSNPFGAPAGPASVSAPRNISHLAFSSLRWGCYMKALSKAFHEFPWYGFGHNLHELDEIMARTDPERSLIETDFSKFDGTHTPEVRGVELAVLLALFAPEYHAEIRELHGYAADNELQSQFGLRIPTCGTRLSGEAGTSACNTLMNVMATLHVLVTTGRAWAPKTAKTADYPDLAWEHLVAYGGDDGVTILPKLHAGKGTKGFLKILEVRYAGLGFKAKIILRPKGKPYTFLGRWRFPGVVGSVASPTRFLRSLEYTSASAGALAQSCGSDDPVIYGAAAAQRKLDGYAATESDPLLRQIIENGQNLAQGVIMMANARGVKLPDDAESVWKRDFSASGPAVYVEHLLEAVVEIEGTSPNMATTPEELMDTLNALAGAESWEAFCNPPPCRPPPGFVEGVRDLGDPMSLSSGAERAGRARKAVKQWSTGRSSTARGRGRGRGRGSSKPGRARS